MVRTRVAIDDDLVARAAEILGTNGIKDTVVAALRSVLVAEARRRAIDQLAAMEGLELDNPEVVAAAWRD